MRELVVEYKNRSNDAEPLDAMDFVEREQAKRRAQRRAAIGRVRKELEERDVATKHERQPTKKRMSGFGGGKLVGEYSRRATGQKRKW